MNTKFIVTQDESTAKKLIAYGFKLVTHSGQTYAFLNEPPKNFNFASVDKTKIAYTPILSL